MGVYAVNNTSKATYPHYHLEKEYTMERLLAVIGGCTLVYAAIKLNNWIVAVRVDDALRNRGIDPHKRPA